MLVKSVTVMSIFATWGIQSIANSTEKIKYVSLESGVLIGTGVTMTKLFMTQMTFLVKSRIWKESLKKSHQILTLKTEALEKIVETKVNISPKELDKDSSL